jgi:hypothetical protein
MEKYVENSQVMDNRTEGYCFSWVYDEIQRNITDHLGIIEVKDDKLPVLRRFKQTSMDHFQNTHLISQMVKRISAAWISRASGQ